MNPDLFWQPKIDGFDGLHAPIYCFLISNGSQHVIFDLGVRPDWESYAPKVVSLIQATTVVTPRTDVKSVLDMDKSDLNIRSLDVEAVIWSHNHFDHIGDVSQFPQTTELVVGPGVRAASWPGWPRREDAIVLDSDAENRVVREVSFDASKLKIGGFNAYDFFGDGSFYLLDAPGHAIGHLCALARTTVNNDESSFVFMGADACHHPGLLRPSEYMPLPPEDVPQGTLVTTKNGSGKCSGAVLQSLLTTPTKPFLTLTPGPMFSEYEAAMLTVCKIQELDAAENIFVLMAHDLSPRDKIPLFPQKINGWRTADLKTKTRWLFCDDFLSQP